MIDKINLITIYIIIIIIINIFDNKDMFLYYLFQINFYNIYI